MRDNILRNDILRPGLDERDSGIFLAYHYGNKTQFTLVKTSLKQLLEETEPAATAGPGLLGARDLGLTKPEGQKDLSELGLTGEAMKDAEQRPDEGITPVRE